MTERETDGEGGRPGRPAGWWAELTAAIGFLTRLPVASLAHGADGLVARSFAVFPLVGAGIGAAGGAVFWGAAAAGLSPLTGAVLAIAFQVWLTRALHEDGLADFADGIGATDPARRLAIMRDSRLGVFGGLALVLGVGLRVAAVAEIAAPRDALIALVAAGALSRAAMVALVGMLGPAVESGLAAAVGRPARARLVLAGGLALAVTGALIAWPWAVAAAMAAALAATAVGRLAARRLGGYTGDVLGTAQQVAEIAVLLVLAGAFAASGQPAPA